ncbi:hypothetical protein GQ600_5171 [Phytophthora cactorum]|nr:hypothetical protein GQ600_5171 [Phytophthora cactorum]
MLAGSVDKNLSSKHATQATWRQHRFTWRPVVSPFSSPESGGANSILWIPNRLRNADATSVIDEDVADPFEADEVFGASARQATSYVLDSSLLFADIYYFNCDSMATLIGLCLRVKLLRSLPPRFKLDIFITASTTMATAC